MLFPKFYSIFNSDILGFATFQFLVVCIQFSPDATPAEPSRRSGTWQGVLLYQVVLLNHKIPLHPTQNLSWKLKNNGQLSLKYWLWFTLEVFRNEIANGLIMKILSLKKNIFLTKFLVHVRLPVLISWFYNPTTL